MLSEYTLPFIHIYSKELGHNSIRIIFVVIILWRLIVSSSEHKQKIWEYIKDIRVGMLTTEHNNELRSRPMHIVQNEYDGTIWFYTNINSEKVFDLKNHRHIGLTFEDQNNEVYVSLTGTAKLSNDKDIIDKFWNPFVAAWFPNGKDGHDVGLIEIKITKGEHWDSNSSRMLQLFEIAKANITNEYPDIGENEKFGD